MSPQACLFTMLFCVDESTFDFPLLPPPPLTWHFILVRLLDQSPIAGDLLTSRLSCLNIYPLDGVRGTSCDALPLWKWLQRRPSPAVAAAVAGEDSPQEQEAQSTPGTGGHPQTEGRKEIKTFCTNACTYINMYIIYISYKASFKWPSRSHQHIHYLTMFMECCHT